MAIIIPTCTNVSCTNAQVMAFLPCFPLDMLPMKHSSLAAGSLATSISGTIASSSSSTPAGLALSSLIDVDDYPHGPVVKVILYHPSLLKIEADFPNVIPVQEIPCNRFFDFKPSSMALGAELYPIPDLIKNWQELLLVLLIRNSIHQICTVLQIPDADAKAALITGVLGQGATFREQDIALSYENFHATRRYLRTVQFKKAMACLDLTSDDKASVTVFIHLENDSYCLLDSILMNPLLSPYTACTNSALRAIVDQLIQQKVSNFVPSPVSTLPSSALHISVLAINAVLMWVNHLCLHLHLVLSYRLTLCLAQNLQLPLLLLLLWPQLHLLLLILLGLFWCWVLFFCSNTLGVACNTYDTNNHLCTPHSMPCFTFGCGWFWFSSHYSSTYRCIHSILNLQ